MKKMYIFFIFAALVSCKILEQQEIVENYEEDVCEQRVITSDVLDEQDIKEIELGIEEYLYQGECKE